MLGLVTVLSLLFIFTAFQTSILFGAFSLFSINTGLFAQSYKHIICLLNPFSWSVQIQALFRTIEQNQFSADAIFACDGYTTAAINSKKSL